MKRILLCLLTAVQLPAAAPKPKLILTVVIDQFRYDYLMKFRSEYHAGFDRLLTQGAVFTNARYDHFPTLTAPGHSTVLSGATPSISGIIANDWWDREAGKKVTSVSDDNTKLLGGTGAGSSPRRMLVSTLGDEIKMANGNKTRVVGISLKDRGAILPSGHMADGAYWFDVATGNFVSSTFYFADLPGWAKDFNASRPADKYKGLTWLSKKLPDTLGRTFYTAIDASPYGNEIVEAFAERALEAEQLGKHDGTDVLTVSFSSNDYVGHDLGPDSPEVRDISIRTDAILEKLFQAVYRQVGQSNVLVVLTADHGVPPMPEVNQARRMPGGRMVLGTVTKAVQAALVARFGEGQWIVSDSDYSLYFNRELIASLHLEPAAVHRVAAEAALALPHVYRVYTREHIISGEGMTDLVGRRVFNGFYSRRGPDLEVLLEPYWIFRATGTTHATAFNYDSHVPVIFMGPGIRAGRYANGIVVNDIAPTLAAMLEVEMPAGSVGRVLTEILEDSVLH